MTTYMVVTRWFGPCAYAARKKLYTVLLLMTCIFTVAILNITSDHMSREDQMELRLADMQAHLQFLDSLYRARQEDVLSMQGKMSSSRANDSSQPLSNPSTTISPEVAELLRDWAGTNTANGINQKNLQQMKTSFVYQLLPHLMADPNSLRPAFHMKTRTSFVDVVMGIPTVRRDKESYLMITLSHLIEGLSENDYNSTLIVVFIGETDLEYVVNISHEIESMFPKHVENGLIEVISPAPSYYPDLDALHPTLKDSAKRFKWRTKQNLDTMFLMAYGQTRGTYYLMLEDDVIAKKFYMKDIKAFTVQTSVKNPDWFIIEYCTVGGIGKLFKSSELLNFITYVQLFYTNMPIDWLVEGYLRDKVCGMDETVKQCSNTKLSIRPRYKTSLFIHIGLYSSLKGKLHKVKNAPYSIPTFFPHVNPPLKLLNTDIEEHSEHTVKKAYDGQTFSWGIKPKKNNVIEFWFEKPTTIERYTFRSGNAEHVNDRFYNSVIEILPSNGPENFTQVNTFDEFGLADGELTEQGPLNAIRIRVLKDSLYWVILSEIEIRTPEDEER